MRRATAFDRVIVWILLPLGLFSAGSLFVSGSFSGFLPLGWTACLWLCHREYVGWRDRVNQWTTHEKADRHRFALDVLLLKSKVVDNLAGTYERAGILSDEEILESLQALYLDVANTWIPADAAPEFHRVRELAATAARTGTRPQLRIIH